MSIYPNPAHETVYIAINPDIKNDCNVKIVSMTGMVLKETKVINHNVISFDVRSLAKGSYVIQLSRNERIIECKVLNVN